MIPKISPCASDQQPANLNCSVAAREVGQRKPKRARGGVLQRGLAFWENSLLLGLTSLSWEQSLPLEGPGRSCLTIALGKSDPTCPASSIWLAVTPVRD